MIKPGGIKRLMQDITAVLYNNHQIDARYYISARGVPYTRVVVGKEHLSFCYFKTTDIFRVFDINQYPTDLKTRDDLMKFFIDKKVAQ
jgi:hypothetical protein